MRCWVLRRWCAGVTRSGGLIEPAAFISDAEGAGPDRPDWPSQVAEQALAQLSHWLNRYGRRWSWRSIFPAFQLRDPDFVREMRALLARHPGVAQQLELKSPDRTRALD